MSVVSVIANTVAKTVKEKGPAVVAKVLLGGGTITAVGQALAGLAREQAQTSLLEQVERAGIDPTGEGYGTRVLGSSKVKSAFVQLPPLTAAQKKLIAVAVAGETLVCEENDLRRLARGVKL